MFGRLKYGVSVILFLGGILILGQVTQSDFQNIILGFGLSFVGYFVFVRKTEFLENKYVVILLGLGVLSRCYFVLGFPCLSDDIFRFYWDSMLIHSGINPFSFTPLEILAQDNLPTNLSIDLFEKLNSKEYYSIYPPIAQLVFYLAGFFKSIGSFGVALKSIIFFGELWGLTVMFKLIKAFDLPKSSVLIYYLNPLVIVEGVGNIHFEILMVPFIISFLLALQKHNVFKSVCHFVLSISVKLTPLLLGPLTLCYLRDKQYIYKFLGFGFLVFLLIFLPVFAGVQIFNLGDSIDLYFRKFEFNASIYYVVRELGFWVSGYNQISLIGPLLAITTLFSILFISSKVKKQDTLGYINIAIFCYLIYLCTATTVHPWYLIPLISLCVFRRVEVVLIWSFLITLSYYTYSTMDWKESWIILLLEYVPIYVLLYLEIRNIFNRRRLEEDIS